MIEHKFEPGADSLGLGSTVDYDNPEVKEMLNKLFKIRANEEITGVQFFQNRMSISIRMKNQTTSTRKENKC